jgi:HlyD family secretion protein
MQTSIANSEIQISQLENNILDLRQQGRQQKNKLLLNLNGAYYNLKANIDIWEKQYIIRAPESGKCVFTQYWSKNQNVTVGLNVFTIIPQKKSNILGKLLLPVDGAGKVRNGQDVNIKLLNYPYMEFGMIRGKISNISPIPNDNNYYVEVTFPDGMKTTYGKILPFSQRMQGTAEIVTNNRSLFSRIIQPLKSVLNEKVRH